MAIFRRKKSADCGPAHGCGPAACGTTPSTGVKKPARGSVAAPPLKDALAACTQGFAALFAFSMAINVLVLASPLYMMQLYDRVLSSRSTDTLIMLTLIVTFSFGVMAALEWVRGRLMVRVSSWLDRRLGGEVLTGSIVGALRQG